MQKKEILTRKFSRAFTGYDIAEVDFFLDELYREFSLMEHELEALRTRLAALEDAAQAAEENAMDAAAELSAAAPFAAAAPLEEAPPPAEASPAEADAAAQTGFYFEQMYTQTAYLQTEDTYTQTVYLQAEEVYSDTEYPQAEEGYPEGVYPQEEAAFLVEAEESPGYGFTQEDAAQGPQQAE